MIRQVVVVALLFATPSGAQVCRGHQSFEAHRARAALQFLDSKKTGSSNDFAMGLGYGLTRDLFVSADYVGDSWPLSKVDDAISRSGGEGFVGVQFGDERLGTFAVCPLLGYGFSGTSGTTLLGSSDIHTRSNIVGLALGAGPLLLSRPEIRLLPSIELQLRFDRAEGTSTFSGTTTRTDSKDQYLLTTVGLGLAYERLTFTPLYQRRFDERLISWGFRISFNFGPAIR